MSVLKELPKDDGSEAHRSAELLPAGYGELTVAKLLPRLNELSVTELWRVQDYERRHANRTPVLDAIERLLD